MTFTVNGQVPMGPQRFSDSPIFTAPTNPLERYFRQPAIYLSLPSRGEFYTKEALVIPESGELPVYPMTAMDEIRARTPDSLFNGTSLVDIIHSCIPDIKDPWSIPSIDLNAILAAIRLASYGEEMDITTRCPNCGEEADMGVDLRMVLDRIKSPDYKTPLQLGDLTFYFGPPTYKDQTDTALAQFESQKIIEMVNQVEISEEERIQQLGNAFRKLTDITADIVTKTIRAVKIPDAMVTDKVHIRQFLDNCPKAIWEAVRDRSAELTESSEIQPFDITCNSCGHEYQQEFTLNMSNFFETAS